MKGLDFLSVFVGVVIAVLALWLLALSYIYLVGVSETGDFEASKFCISKNQNLVLYKGNAYYCDGGAIFIAKDND